MTFQIVQLKPTQENVVDATVILTLTGLGLHAFRSSFGGWAYLVLGILFASIGVVISHIGQRLDLPLAVIAVVAILAYAILGGAAALPSRAFAGFIPSPASVSHALITSVTGWKELLTTAPPIGRTGDLMVIPVFAGITSGMTGYLAATRMRLGLLALLPPVTVLALAIATGTDKPVSVVIQGSVFGVVGLGWLAWREHNQRPLLAGSRAGHGRLATGVGVLLIAAVGGYALADTLPLANSSNRDIWRQTVTPPFDPREYPSPLSQYRKYTALAADAVAEDPVLITVEGLPPEVPVRLATMDTYDGLVWQVSAGDSNAPSLRDSGSFERVGASVQPDFAGELAVVTVTIGDYNDVWIPSVGEVIDLQFVGSTGGKGRDRQLADYFRYNRSTDTAASRLFLQTGDRYVMTVRLPALRDALEGEEIIPTISKLGPSLQIDEISQKLVGPDILAINDSGRRLDKIRTLMVEAGTYSDGDRDSGHIRVRSGHSKQRLVSFVNDYPDQPLIGNAEQYASSYALLFRSLNRIPTRVVMGFLPSASSTDRPVEVRASEIEAWVEVPVAEHGWVAIFPTPPRDQTALQSSSPRQPEPDYRTQNPPPPPLIDPEFDRSATAAGDAQAPDANDVDSENENDSDGSLVSGRTLALAALGLTPPMLFSGIIFTVIAVKTRRRRRRRSSGPGHQRIANGWHEVTDFALDAGMVVPPSITRRETAIFVGPSTTVLAERADAAVWGAGEPDAATVDAYWSDLVAELDSMRSKMSKIDSFKSYISLQSLKPEKRRDRQTASG